MNLPFLRQLSGSVAPDRRLLTIIAGLILSGEAIAVLLPLLLAWLLNHLAASQLNVEILIKLCCSGLNNSSLGGGDRRCQGSLQSSHGHGFGEPSAAKLF